MTTVQMVAEAKIAGLRNEEKVYDVIMQDELMVINEQTGLGLLTKDNLSELNLRPLQASIARLVDAQEKLLKVRTRIQEIQLQINGQH